MVISIVPAIPAYSCKNIKLFRPFRRAAIDISPSDPMFALDAAPDSKREFLSKPPVCVSLKSRASLRAVPGLSATVFSEIPDGGFL
jgi:hypothetical protein